MARFETKFFLILIFCTILKSQQSSYEKEKCYFYFQVKNPYRFLYFFSIAYALICYTCDSLVDGYCNDEFYPASVPKNATMKCQNDAVCVKLKFKIGCKWNLFCPFTLLTRINTCHFWFQFFHKKAFPKPLVRRECNTPNSSDFHAIASLGQFNQCNHDKCNGSAAYGPIAPLIAIPVMMLLLLSWVVYLVRILLFVK